MTRQRLKWLAILVPTVSGAVLVLAHHLLHYYIPLSFGWFYLSVMAVILVGAYLFTFFVFRTIDKLEQRVRQKNQEVAVLQERDRLAKEVHDGLAQVLGFLSLKAEATRDLVSQGQSSQAQAELQEMERVTREAYADAREAILGLRTSVGLDGGLVRSLTEYVNIFRRQSGIDAELVIPPNLHPFSPAVEVQLIRIIQEALTNVRKHARATKARLSFTVDDGRAEVAVEDNGQGFDPAQVRARGGFGLQSMKERAEAVGGRLHLKSSPQGTRVAVELPLRKER